MRKKELKWYNYYVESIIGKRLGDLGFYDSLEDAAKARKQAEEKMFGTFIDEHQK